MFDLKVEVGHSDGPTTAWDDDLLLPDVWPQNKSKSKWPVFMIQWFASYL